MSEIECTYTNVYTTVLASTCGSAVPFGISFTTPTPLGNNDFTHFQVTIEEDMSTYWPVNGIYLAVTPQTVTPQNTPEYTFVPYTNNQIVFTVRNSPLNILSPTDHLQVVGYVNNPVGSQRICINNITLIREECPTIDNGNGDENGNGEENGNGNGNGNNGSGVSKDDLVWLLILIVMIILLIILLGRIL